MTVDRSRLPDLGRRRPFAFPIAQRATLDNGIRVRAVHHSTVPVVALLLVVPAGSAADPVAAPGLAALTADLLDEGCGGLTSLAFHEALASIGGVLDVETGPDATVVTLVSLTVHLQRAFELLADLAFRPRFDQHEFERVRDLRVNRLAQLKDVPSAVADRAFMERLFGQHPYGHLAIGSEAALAAATRESVAEFHAQRYTPRSASLLVVGDIDPTDGVGAAQRTLGAVQGQADDAGSGGAPSHEGPLAKGPRVVVIDRPGAPQSELRIGRVAASRRTPDYHDLVVLNAVLGGQFVSRINLKLREERGLTYGARSAFDCRRAPGPFSIQTSVQTDGTAEAIREVLDVCDELGGRRPATDAELQLARASLTLGYARNFETAEQIGRALAQMELFGLPDRYYDEFPERIEAVEATGVTRAASRWLVPDAMIAVIVGDRARVGPDLAAIGLSPDDA